MAKPAGITVQIIPSVIEIQGRLSAVALSLRSFRIPLQMAVRNIIAPRFYQNFDDSGAPGEQRWAPLQTGTVAWKFQNGFARYAVEPLLRTGKLQKASAYQNNWTISAESASFETLREDVAYGFAHQYGFYHNRGGYFVEARPWAVISEEDIDKIMGIFETFALAKFGV